MSATAAVVLAGGRGERMKSRLPKPLHRICGIEMSRHVIRAASRAGVEWVTLVAPQARYWPVRDVIGAYAAVVAQPEPLGSGHALMQARNALRGAKDVLALNADVPLVRAETVRRLLETHAELQADVTMLTCVVEDPRGLGRVVRSESGDVLAVMEERDADAAQRAIREINCGVYAFRAEWVRENLPLLQPSSGGEIYLTSLIEAAARQGRIVATVAASDPTEAMGVNDRVELARAEAVMRERIRERWMLSGVTMQDPATAYIDADVQIGPDTLIMPNTHLRGNTRVGADCVIGPNSVVEDTTIGARCNVVASHLERAVLADDVEVGPFSHLRPGARLESGVHLGNFVEVKNSRLGPGATSGHFSYIGDSLVGADVNVGAGSSSMRPSVSSIRRPP